MNVSTFTLSFKWLGVIGLSSCVACAVGIAMNNNVAPQIKSKETCKVSNVALKADRSVDLEKLVLLCGGNQYSDLDGYFGEKEYAVINTLAATPEQIKITKYQSRKFRFIKYTTSFGLDKV